MEGKFERYPENAAGPFYVEKDLCLICRAPEAEAPGLMAFTEAKVAPAAHCYFKRQPASPQETDQAIRAICVACCGTLRYAGRDPTILRRLRALGHEVDCDYPLTDELPGAVKD